MKDLFTIYQNFDESIKDEILNQAKALQKLIGDVKNSTLERALINIYGSEFRRIINEFKDMMRGTPSPDDLIWIAGVHTKEDPRMVANRLKMELRL